jgi:hypothetical protein
MLGSEILRLAVADREIEAVVGIEGEPGAVVALARRVEGLGDEQFLEIAQFQRVDVEPRAADIGRALALVIGAGPGHVEPVLLGEIGIERDVEQAALPLRMDVRQAGNLLDLAASRSTSFSRPGRSLTSRRPSSGRKAMPQALSKPSATVSIS